VINVLEIFAAEEKKTRKYYNF